MRAPWWFVVPAAAMYLFVVVVPSLRGAVYSFTDWNGMSAEWDFVGIANFVEVVTDRRALAALRNTVVLAAVVTIVQNVIGLLLALALNSVFRSRFVLRVVFFAPVVLTPLVSGYIWSYLLAPRGAVNQALISLGLEGWTRDWLGDPATALYAICLSIIWQFSGYSMVIFLAGLQAIPEDVLEAATIDGAGAWRRFWNVVLPLLNGAVVINLMLSLIGGLKQFDQVMAMTGGGPGIATETISTTIYKNAFSSGEYPVSIALAVVMTMVIAILATIQYRLTLRKAD
ncbi:raffinose/stachyose/melibiose transport system permease protein [Tessaracoccus oleiagri]|uniref:Raffinose/stachyose/melibiose transport system permease protein n=1 Tax=Tessaracoccus oleiagri TaxID=686624 RepID=A0A1G9HLT7_9ACTN|nr:raffinose/stachyose/melibiose transport system permease protein [Tessaracoccus oleiagri]